VKKQLLKTSFLEMFTCVEDRVICNLQYILCITLPMKYAVLAVIPISECLLLDKARARVPLFLNLLLSNKVGLLLPQIQSESEIGAHFQPLAGFFGRNLYDNLQVPIGLFSDNWGGTPVQAWSSADALKKCPGKSKPTEKVGGPNDPSNLWNAMILPVLSMTIKGALWYQGESNSGQPNYYACGFPAMIADWREKWGGTTSKTFPFYYVQLAPWLNGDVNSEPLTRLSQLFANALPLVGFATAADLGDPLSPYGSIHPRGKQEIGKRLALAARGISYGQTVAYLGPMATSFTAVSGTSVRVDFDPNTLGGGLTTVPVSCDPNVPAAQCSEYELGTAQGWVKATGAISGNSVIVTANVGSAITGVRYGHNNYPLMSLQNKAGLPAIPFMFPNPIKP